jgi:cytochrome c55X
MTRQGLVDLLGAGYDPSNLGHFSTKGATWMKSRLLAAGLLSLLTAAVAAEPDGARAAELRYLLVQDCGSCHGLTFRGGLGPALLPQTLQGKPEEYLAATILYGRPGTPMPPWQPFLSQDEAVWLARQLKEGVQ